LRCSGRLSVIVTIGPDLAYRITSSDTVRTLL
jgi:hypothetical protein